MSYVPTNLVNLYRRPLYFGVSSNATQMNSLEINYIAFLVTNAFKGSSDAPQYTLEAAHWGLAEAFITMPLWTPTLITKSKTCCPHSALN